MSFAKKILVPTDFSEGSASALEFAISLARERDGSIHLVHAYQIPSMVFMDGVVVTPPAMVSGISAGAQKRLDQVEAQVREAGIEVASHLLQGPPYQEIISAIDLWECDLIVMATHGRSGWQHALMGSVAERVVRLSTIPVLTLGPKDRTSAA